MARTLFANGVQLASFKGIYTTPGDVFTPGPLLWENPDVGNGNYFPNTRGKCFIVVENTDLDLGDDILLTIDATTTVPETPDSLPVVDPVVEVKAGEANIIGPFTGNFEDDGDIGIDYVLEGSLAAGSVNIAVVQLP